MNTYQPLGTRVLLKVIENPKGPIVLPDGVRAAGIQRFKVVALGGLVNTANPDDNKLHVDDIVQIATHSPVISGIDPEQGLIVCDRSEIAVIVTTGAPNE
jgi:co-chaperonin GroES (HSP10)